MGVHPRPPIYRVSEHAHIWYVYAGTCTIYLTHVAWAVNHTWQSVQGSLSAAAAYYHKCIEWSCSKCYEIDVDGVWLFALVIFDNTTLCVVCITWHHSVYLDWQQWLASNSVICTLLRGGRSECVNGESLVMSTFNYIVTASLLAACGIYTASSVIPAVLRPIHCTHYVMLLVCPLSFDVCPLYVGLSRQRIT